MTRLELKKIHTSSFSRPHATFSTFRNHVILNDVISPSPGPHDHRRSDWCARKNKSHPSLGSVIR